MRKASFACPSHAEPPISSFVSQNIPEILRSGQVTFQDFHRNEHDQRVYLALLVPILDESDANRPLGVLALRIDPETYLYPFIKRWPTPSLTAETLLVRRDGNDALCLNELKFRTNTALNLRISLENTNSACRESGAGAEQALWKAGIIAGRRCWRPCMPFRIRRGFWWRAWTPPKCMRRCASG